jgi:hypothetical protein
LPPLNLYARVRFSRTFCTRDRGCSAHPAFPEPSVLFGRSGLQISGASAPRDREAAFANQADSKSRCRPCERRTHNPGAAAVMTGRFNKWFRIVRNVGGRAYGPLRSRRRRLWSNVARYRAASIRGRDHHDAIPAACVGSDCAPLSRTMTAVSGSAVPIAVISGCKVKGDARASAIPWVTVIICRIGERRRVPRIGPAVGVARV